MNKQHKELLDALASFKAWQSTHAEPQPRWYGACADVFASSAPIHDERIPEPVATQHGVVFGTTWRDLAHDLNRKLPDFADEGWTGRDISGAP
jgi:hypothetical protein